MNATAQLRRMMMPKVKGETFSFPEKENPSKIWWAWKIEVNTTDRNGMPIKMAEYYSFDQGTKLLKGPELYKNEETAKKVLWDCVEKVKGIIQRGFGGTGKEGFLDLRKGGFKNL